MINNFDSLKEQLNELSPIINSFKSEAVQLRIVELIFAQGARRPEHRDSPESPSSQDTLSSPTEESKRTRRRSRSKTNLDSGGKKVQRKSSGKGLTAILDRQITEGYFSQPRQVADIVEHCRHSLATICKATEVSVFLGRAIKSGKLKRERDEHGQYQYTKS
jgi:hypothetical protein